MTPTKQPSRRKGKSQMRLAWILREWRWAVKWTVVDAAKAIGLSKATYYRIEQGYPASGENLALVLEWLLNQTYEGTNAS